VQSRNAAFPQIRFCDGARDRSRHREQEPGGFRGTALRVCQAVLAVWIRLRSRQPQKGARFLKRVAKAVEAAIERDEIEKIAMLARGGIRPLAGSAFAGIGAAQADEQTAAGRISHIADEPVAAFAPAIGEIVAAHRLGILRETAGQLGSLRYHGRLSRRCLVGDADERKAIHQRAEYCRGC
jgi:hypothetical protein